MNTFHLSNKALNIVATFFLVALISCQQELILDQSQLSAPQLKVTELTCTGFTVSWDIVDNADGYVYEFNGTEPVFTRNRRISFKDLEPNQNYLLKLYAKAGYNGSFKDSEYVELSLNTSDLSKLSTPEPEIVVAYISKTVIKWKAISGASYYEYEVGKYKGRTESCNIELSGFDESTKYTFKLRAVSTDKYVNPSEYAQMEFTTLPSTEDIPQIIMDLNEVGPDYVDFNIYAVPDFRYLYFAVPAPYFETHTDEQIMNIYLGYVLTAIKQSGNSVVHGIENYVSYGSANYVSAPLYPQMSYKIVAFGVNSDGQATTSLYKLDAKTIADDESSGPEKEGPAWFKQSLFHYTYGAYNASNSLWVMWKGTDVVQVKSFLTSTYSFNTYFNSSMELLEKYVQANGSAFDNPENLERLNSENGFTSYYKLNPSTSYTMASIAKNSEGQECFVVNSLPTKATSTYYHWAFVKLGQSTSLPATTSLTGSFSIAFDSSESLNISLSSLKYYFCKSSQMEGLKLIDATKLVDEKGTDLPEISLNMLNMTGKISLSFGEDEPLESGVQYILLANFTNKSGDRTTRFASASTAAEPQTSSLSKPSTNAVCKSKSTTNAVCKSKSTTNGGDNKSGVGKITARISMDNAPVLESFEPCPLVLD